MADGNSNIEAGDRGKIIRLGLEPGTLPRRVIDIKPSPQGSPNPDVPTRPQPEANDSVIYQGYKKATEGQRPSLRIVGGQTQPRENVWNKPISRRQLLQRTGQKTAQAGGIGLGYKIIGTLAGLGLVGELIYNMIIKDSPQQNDLKGFFKDLEKDPNFATVHKDAIAKDLKVSMNGTKGYPQPNVDVSQNSKSWEVMPSYFIDTGFLVYNANGKVTLGKDDQVGRVITKPLGTQWIGIKYHEAGKKDQYMFIQDGDTETTSPLNSRPK